MVRLNRRVGYNRDTYLLCRLCDRVAMIPEQVRRKLDVGQGHIVGQVAVYFPVEPVGQIRAAHAGFTTGTPWIPLNPNYPQINAAKQVGDPDSVYSFYRRLLALRKSDKTFVYGHYALLLPDDEEIYAYTRTLNDEQILVVCNFTDHDVPCPLLNDWQNTELLISNYTPPDPPEVCDRLKRWFTESKTQRINLNPTLYYLKMQVVAGAVAS